MNPFPIDVIIAPNDPNVWDVLTAIGTVGAVVATVLLGALAQWLSSRQHKTEMSRLKSDRDEARKAQRRAESRESRRLHQAQALRVSVWVHDDPGWAPEVRGTVAVVGNYSDAPVFDIELDVRCHDGHRQSVDTLHRLLPGQFTEVTDLFPAEIRSEIRSIKVTFRDVQGTVWERDLHGGLTEVYSPEPD